MEIVKFALSGLLLAIVWHFMLRKTVLDHHRDQLFDLRDELRAQFVSNRWDMNSPIYRRMRDLINGYLRFTENYSFWETYVLEGYVRKNPELTEALRKHNEQKFFVRDEAQKEFVGGIRHRAVWIMMRYMVLSSGPLVLALLIVAPLFVCVVAFLGTVQIFKMGTKSLANKLEQAGGVLAAFLRYVLFRTIRFLWDEDFVEDMSLRQRVRSDYKTSLA